MSGAPAADRGTVIAIANESTGARAEVALHGAHLLSWFPSAAAPDALFVSSKSGFQGAGVAIRGGVPVCFPQFAAQGPLPNHGFARSSDDWRVVSHDGSSVTLSLASSAATLAIWPHAFETTLAFRLEDTGALTLSWAVRNTGAAPLEFTQALHTYFSAAFADGASPAVRGLIGCEYLDKTDAFARKRDAADSVTFDREVDRAYLAVPPSLQLDTARGWTVSLATTGFADAVVWNPWAAKAAAMKDLGDAEYLQFVCVEAGNVGAPVALAAGAEWHGTLRLTAA
eukprot:c8725_g1_i1.p1 GENE.c8725_g1_i1~~c8725_g1_i1.p1  ORF type:complete len:297 (+),score=30.17 c8725_g1_i1:42-893(+)